MILFLEILAAIILLPIAIVTILGLIGLIVEVIEEVKYGDKT